LNNRSHGQTYFPFSLNVTEKDTERSRQESKRKIEEIQLQLREATSQLHDVERERRDANTSLEQHQEDLKILQTIIDEEQQKANSEIMNILSSFKTMEETMLERQEHFDSLLVV